MYMSQKLWKLVGSRQSYWIIINSLLFGPPCSLLILNVTGELDLTYEVIWDRMEDKRTPKLVNCCFHVHFSVRCPFFELDAAAELKSSLKLKAVTPAPPVIRRSNASCFVNFSAYVYTSKSESPSSSKVYLSLCRRQLHAAAPSRRGTRSSLMSRLEVRMLPELHTLAAY